ncbi:MAG: hypothetical protein JKY65_26630 [Planctomycetes bacterium]|nr:hypothetical protein [Planctomycetota bacterium]
MIDVHDLGRLKARAPVDLVCESLGIELDPRGEALCPVHEERTPSFHVRPTLGTFKCFGCGVSGDVLDLVQLVTGCEFLRAVERLRSIAGQGTAAMDTPQRRTKPRMPKPPSRVPLAEVRSLWESCFPVGIAQPVARWLQRRSLDVRGLEALDLVRALPLNPVPPRWARSRGGSWRESGHLAVLPVFDARGSLAGLRARAVTTGPERKELSACGQTSRGLVYACPRGRSLLATRNGVRRLVVCEGWPDFATWATRLGDDAVLGIYSGAWSEELAERVPSGLEVLIRRHEDEAGAAYAEGVARTLADRCDVKVLDPRARGGIA